MVSKTNLKVDVLENREISKLKDAVSKSKVHLSETESKLEIANKSNKNLEDKLSKTQLENKNLKLENEKKLKELEINLQVSCIEDLVFIKLFLLFPCYRMKKRNRKS